MKKNFDFFDALSFGLYMVGANFWRLILISIIVGILSVVSFFISMQFISGLSIITIVIIMAIFGGLLGCFIMGVIIRTAVVIAQDGEISIGELLMDALVGIFPLFPAMILFGILVGAPSFISLYIYFFSDISSIMNTTSLIILIVFLAIWAIIMLLKFMFFGFVIFDKGFGPIKSLGMSWKITNGAVLRLILLFILFGLLGWLISWLTGMFNVLSLLGIFGYILIFVVRFVVNFFTTWTIFLSLTYVYIELMNQTENAQQMIEESKKN